MAYANVRDRRCGRWLALFGIVLSAASLQAREPAGKDTSVSEMVQFINGKLDAQWKENKIKPSEVCSDYDFIRRVSLDIIGRIAKPEEITKFMADSQQTRRALLVDRLLQSDEYPRNWANMWSNWLLTRSGPFGKDMYHDQTHVWLEDQFAQFKPFDKIVYELLTEIGRAHV